MDPRSSARQLLELLKNIYRGDKNSQESLVSKYKDFISWQSGHYKIKYERKYQHLNLSIIIDEEDLFQEGVIGLLTAVWDKNHWIAFSHYAKKKICAAIESAIRQEVAFQLNFSALKSAFAEYRRCKMELVRKGHLPLFQEIAAIMQISVEKAEQLARFYNVAANYQDQGA